MTSRAQGNAERKHASVHGEFAGAQKKVLTAGEVTEGAHSMSEGSFDSEGMLPVSSPEPVAVVSGSPHATNGCVSAVDDPLSVEGAASHFAKRVLDVFGSLGLAVIFSPLILIVAIILRRHGGVVIYKHRRVGVHGEIFECLKFRTMIPDADRRLHELLAKDDRLKAEWLETHKLKDDPRVTRLGRFLRKTSLDELPQLWNVLRGEMSLVGPRPVVREELLRYGRSASVYLSAKPGLTGLWQTTGRNDTDYRRRVAMDVYYVRNRSMRLDLWILLKTARVVLGRDGAY